MTEQLDLLSFQTATESIHPHSQLRIRESRRAQRMYMHVVPPLDIELVVPRGTSTRTVEEFVTSNRVWIERAKQEIDLNYEGDRNQRPELIELQATGGRFQVSYRHLSAKKKPFARAGERINIYCQEPDLRDAPEALRTWLRDEGRRQLPLWLAQVANRVGDQPSRIQVRLQRTRWGSCSTTGTISLNAALLFLEPPLVEYLMIHELCHMRHMNHSRRFWAHVAKYASDWRSLDNQLANSWKKIPYWAASRSS